MKAVRWYKAKDVRIDEVPEPQVKPDTVKVKVKWCGICGSDLHEYLAGPIFIPVGQPHPLTGEMAPVILGHEFSGEVVEVGSEVVNLKPGDRVVVEPMDVCGKCPACKSGKYNLCTSLGFASADVDTGESLRRKKGADACTRCLALARRADAVFTGF